MSSVKAEKRKPVHTASHCSQKKEYLVGGDFESKVKEEASNEQEVSEKISELRYAIQQVRNMTLIPSVYKYTVETENNLGLSAVDIDRNCSYLAFAIKNSIDIVLSLGDKENALKPVSLEELTTAYRSFKESNEGISRQEVSSSLARNLKGHTQLVTGLSFVSQKEYLLSCSFDGSVRAWSMEDFRLVELYSAHRQCFSGIAVSSNSPYFATSCISSSSCLFTFERKEPVKYFIGHKDDIVSMSFHPNGLYIATASQDKTIKLWTTQSARAVRSFQDDCCPTALAFSPNRTHLASYSGKQIKIWDLASGRLVNTLDDSDSCSSQQCLSFNTSGDILASGGQHKKINLWNINHSSSQNSHDSSLQVPECNLLKSHNSEKKIYLLKFINNGFLACVTA